MLEGSLFESQDRVKTRKPLTLVLSVMAHVATVATLVLIPLLQTQALTIPPVDMSLFLPRIERPRSVPVFPARPHADRQRPSSEHSPVFSAPQAIPREIVKNVNAPTTSDLPVLPFNSGSGITSLPTSFATAPIAIPTVVAPPQPPPPPPPVVKTDRIRQHSSVQSANLIYQVKPVYPPIARQTRTQGVVVLEAVIDKDGSIQSLRVVSGHPLLTQAALDAVKQWKYRPTMLNGDPIEVITTVTVTFTLQ